MKYFDKIIAQKKIYSNDKYNSDNNCRLTRRTRSRIPEALQGKTKSSSTKDVLGIDIDTYRKWIEFQIPPDMIWDNIGKDHVEAICMFDVSKEEESKEGFNYKNTQPLLKKDHQQKGAKLNFLDYQLQFIKVYQFIQLREGKFNENIH